MSGRCDFFIRVDNDTRTIPCCFQKHHAGPHRYDEASPVVSEVARAEGYAKGYAACQADMVAWLRRDAVAAPSPGHISLRIIADAASSVADHIESGAHVGAAVKNGGTLG